jgi:hypothetical protein
MHLAIGLAGILAFLASGMFMHLRYNHLAGLEDTIRLLFRSTHIYLLLAAVLNVALGLYLIPASGSWRTWLQRVGSILVLAGPPLFAGGFLTEPWLSGLDRPWTRPGVICSFAGMLLHLISNVPSRTVVPKEPLAP